MRALHVAMTFLLLAAALGACASDTTGTTVDTPADTAADEPTTESSMEGASADQADQADQLVSFAVDVMPIMEDSCTSCHGGDWKQGGLGLESYTDLMAGADDGPVVVPGDSGSSSLVRLVKSQEMPKQGPALKADQVSLLADWVDQGALDN